jgi:hypothetical protein
MDNVPVWLDPADTWAEGLPTFSFDAACWLLPTTDPDRLIDTLVLSVSNVGANADVIFDEIRMAETWSDLFLPLSGTLPGDFNDDGTVDAADYVVWRNTGINGQQGYNDWRANFGQSAGSGSLSSTAVPEPAVALLLLFGSVRSAKRIFLLSR